MTPEEQIGSVAHILIEYGQGCSNGPPGACLECAYGALKAISTSVGVDLAAVPPNPHVEPLWHFIDPVTPIYQPENGLPVTAGDLVAMLDRLTNIRQRLSDIVTGDWMPPLATPSPKGLAGDFSRCEHGQMRRARCHDCTDAELESIMADLDKAISEAITA